MCATIQGDKKVTFKEASIFAMPFGKHKGKPLYQVPLDYMDWLVGKMEEGKQANTRTYKAMVCYLQDPAVSKELDEVLMERRGREEG